MPQNAEIAASGGDYTSDVAWGAAEQDSDYGAPTVGRVNGDITRAVQYTHTGTWTNGARLEAFSNDFDGDTNSTHPRIISTAGINHTRNTSGTTLEIAGIGIVSGSSSFTLDVRATAGSIINTDGAYIEHTNNSMVLNQDTGSMTLTNTVVNSTGTGRVSNDSGITFESSTIFSARTLAGVLNSGTANDTVVYAPDANSCYAAGVTQSNNASSDATADTLDNITLSEFVDSDPVANGNFKIAAGSDLDTNSIGAFIQTAGGETLIVDSGTFTISGTAIPLFASFNTSAESGSYSLAGTDVTLQAVTGLIVDSGSYNLTGTDVGLIFGYSITAETAAYTLIGTSQLLRADINISANTGAYSLLGTETPIRHDANTSASSGVFNIAGTNVNLAANYVIIAATTSYTLTGSNVTLKYSGDVALDIGVITAFFGDDGVSASYKPSEVITSYKVNSTTVSFKG